MRTKGPAHVVATSARDAPYLVAAGDEGGQLCAPRPLPRARRGVARRVRALTARRGRYLCKFGATAPAVPKPSVRVQPPERPSRACTIL
jgi:hypothetical protein